MSGDPSPCFHSPDLEYFKDVLRANGYVVIAKERQKVLTVSHRMDLNDYPERHASFLKHVRGSLLRDMIYKADDEGLITSVAHERVYAPERVLVLQACFTMPRPE